MKTAILAVTFLLSLAIAHPSNFSPNHASLQKRCPPFDPAGVKNIGNNAGTQFIGGQCLSNKDCASACCALPCGICSGPGASFQAGKQGCGFGSGASAAAATTGSGGTGTGFGPGKTAAPASPSAAPVANGNENDPGSRRAGNPNSCATT